MSQIHSNPSVLKNTAFDTNTFPAKTGAFYKIIAKLLLSLSDFIRKI